eukprot:TRINITY_DN1769_c0_g1_i9.p1 TRINITY_DN1769_c0_g1~~TRINITY_DN1769_c0_g1_i9.p1  ORF type:complete len:204 (-),score=42.88 TRINITY_DN1769_c0_g1_i9:115-726(-)
MIWTLLLPHLQPPQQVRTKQWYQRRVRGRVMLHSTHSPNDPQHTKPHHKPRKIGYHLSISAMQRTSAHSLHRITLFSSNILRRNAGIHNSTAITLNTIKSPHSFVRYNSTNTTNTTNTDTSKDGPTPFKMSGLDLMRKYKGSLYDLILAFATLSLGIVLVGQKEDKKYILRKAERDKKIQDDEAAQLEKEIQQYKDLLKSSSS